MITRHSPLATRLFARCSLSFKLQHPSIPSWQAQARLYIPVVVYPTRHSSHHGEKPPRAATLVPVRVHVHVPYHRRLLPSVTMIPNPVVGFRHRSRSRSPSSSIETARPDVDVRRRAHRKKRVRFDSPSLTMTNDTPSYAQKDSLEASADALASSRRLEIGRPIGPGGSLMGFIAGRNGQRGRFSISFPSCR